MTALIVTQYVASCAPCQYDERCESLDEALEAVEEHNADNHAEATA